MHEFWRPYHLTAEGGSDGLMSEADSENRDFPGKMADQLNADAGFLRSARPRRNQDAFGAHGFYIADRYLIVAAHLDFRAQFAQILHQVVGEGIVIVEDKNHSALKTAYIRPNSGGTCPQVQLDTAPATRHATDFRRGHGRDHAGQ